MSLFNELKRRNVFKVTIAYIVVAWLVAQVLELVFDSFGTPAWVMKTVLVLMVAGLAFAVFFAWAFEMTPEGLKRESEVERDRSITAQTGRKLNGLIVVLMGLALAYFAYDKFVLSAAREAALVEAATLAATGQAATEEAPAKADNSIAVLPFVNMSDDASNEFFSDGISEELLNLLAKIPELRVTSRSSAFAYKGKDIDIPVVAEKLGVAHILEGSVRKAGNQVRITAQLIEARSDTHLWSETYDRQLDDIFAIQDEISAKVVEQLKITLLGAVPKSVKTDSEAYSLYLQARHLGRLTTADDFEKSNALYRQGLSIDPAYVAAWSGLAGNYVNQANYGLLTEEEGYTLSVEANQKALAIDPDFAQGHGRLGWIAMVHDNDLEAAARHFQRAHELDPLDQSIISNIAVFLSSLGRWDQDIAIYKYLTTRNPADPGYHNNLGIGYLYTGQWDEAIESYRSVLRLSPGYIRAHYRAGSALLLKGETEAALAEFELEGSETYKVKGLALANYALGQMDSYQEKLSEFTNRWGAERPLDVSQVFAWTGQPDEAFAWLEKARKDGIAGYILYDPWFEPLKQDPRWPAFLDAIGYAPAKLDAIEFKLTLPE